MSHSEDESEAANGGAGSEGEDANEAGEGATEDAVSRAKAVSMTRLLTPADFAAMKKARLQEAMDLGAARKRKAGAVVEETGVSKDAAVSVDDIERLHKKQKMDREQRIAALKANKGEKDKWLTKKEMRKQDKEIGTTNTDKKKTKKYVVLANSPPLGWLFIADVSWYALRLQLHHGPAQQVCAPQEPSVPAREVYQGPQPEAQGKEAPPIG